MEKKVSGERKFLKEAKEGVKKKKEEDGRRRKEKKGEESFSLRMKKGMTNKNSFISFFLVKEKSGIFPTEKKGEKKKKCEKREGEKMQLTNSPFYHQLVPRCSVNKQDDQFVPLHFAETPAFKRKKK